MSDKASNQWNFVRFFTTLGYFGEVPFVGSFRWLQKWLGQNPTIAGKALNSMQKKVVVVGNYPQETVNLLQERLSLVELSADRQIGDGQIGDSAQSDDPVVRSHQRELICEAIKVADTLVVWDGPNFSSLVSDLSACLHEDSDSVEPGTVSSNIVSKNAFDFTQASSDISAWGALDDVVMGGVSEGSFFMAGSKPRSAVFAGRVSTENSGGFSSVRTRNFEPPFNFQGQEGLWLRVKGDGQRYKFIVRNSQSWDSPAYVYIFDTVADEWIDVRVPFADLVPTFRAKSVPSSSPFDPGQTVSFQLMLSKFEYDGRLNPQFSAGPFNLAVAKIEAYRKRQGVPLVVVGAADAQKRDQQQSALADSGLRYRFIEPKNQDLVDAIAVALS